MEQCKGERTENVAPTDQQKAVAESKDDHRVQDPGTGYYRRNDSGGEDLKNSVSRQKWEH